MNDRLYPDCRMRRRDARQFLAHLRAARPRCTVALRRRRKGAGAGAGAGAGGGWRRVRREFEPEGWWVLQLRRIPAVGNYPTGLLSLPAQQIHEKNM